MKKRIINFGDIQLIGAVGEWGLFLTDQTGATEKGLPPAFQSKQFVFVHSLMPSDSGFSFSALNNRDGAIKPGVAE